MGCFPSKVTPKSPTSILPTPTPTPTPPSPTPPPSPPPPPPPLPADKVDIVIDKGKDEHKIFSTIESYPAPEPPKENKASEHWFTDEDYNNASDDADLLETETAVDTVPIEVDGRRAQRPPVNKPSKRIPKIDFQAVDDHAQKATASVLDSYSALTSYLRGPYKGDRFERIKSARAIVAWMAAQNIDTENYGEPTLDNPRGLMQYLKQGQMTYPNCYARLCREAGLECALINGYCKAARYEPGDKDVPTTLWNAVYTEHGWQIVHPFWICRALYGHNMGGWIKLESDGTRMAARQGSSAGVVKSTFQERYFMPKPTEFLYECCALDLPWQLVETEHQVANKKEFLKKPYLLPPFHGLGLTLVSQQQSELESEDGLCRIEFKGKSATAHHLSLSYELFKKDDNPSDDFTDTDLPRMVFNSRSNEYFKFEVRFPIEGSFKLVIYGGPYKSSALRICEFKITCRKRMAGCRLLPLKCNQIGYGPGPATVEAGLLIPSKPTGFISVNKTKTLKSEIKFRLRDDFVSLHEYSAAIHGDDEELERCDSVSGRGSSTGTRHLSVTITQDLELIVVVAMPKEGEYGVTILHGSSSHAGIEMTSVCNYLVSTLKYTRRIVKADEFNARKSLSEACEENATGKDMKNKIENIDNCLNKCRKYRIPDDDEDVSVAAATREYLWYKNELRDCELRDNLHVIDKTLRLVQHYKYKDALRKQIKSVEKVREKLIKEQETKSKRSNATDF